MKTFSAYSTQFGDRSNNSATTNLTYGMQLINESLRYLTTKYFFNEATYVIPGGTVAGQQAYGLPFDMKTITDLTITVGTTRYLLQESPNAMSWDSTLFVPYSSDIPQYYYIYQGQLNVFPTPASSSNVMTIRYKKRLTDLSIADYTTGTVTLTNGSTTVTGSGTTFTSAMVGRWIQGASTSGGDNAWYKIATFTNTTTLVLQNQYQGITTSGISYIIGEVPLLPEDYQDLPLYRALHIYYSSRIIDEARAGLYQTLYDDGFAKLDAEFGSKSNSVAIQPMNQAIVNPNLYLSNIG